MKRRKGIWIGIAALLGVAVVISILVRQLTEQDHADLLIDLTSWTKPAYTLLIREYRPEEDMTYQYSVSDPDVIQQFVDYINGHSATRVKSTEGRNLDSNFVFIELRNFPEFVSFCSWQDGYWVDNQGNIFQVELDMEELAKSFDWEFKSTHKGDNTYSAEVMYHRAVNEGEWTTSLLTESEEPVETTLALEVTDLSDRILTVKLTNQGVASLLTEDDYRVQVKLDDIWYDVPKGFTYYSVLHTPCYLEAGQSLEKRFDLAEWGAWPAGDYRIVIGEAAAEFHWKGDMKSYPQEPPEMILADHTGMIELDTLTFTKEYENYPLGTEEIYYFMGNGIGKKMYYGHTRSVEVFVDGEWYSLPYNHRASFPMTLQSLGTGEQYVGNILLYMHDYVFPVGKYRMLFQYGLHEKNQMLGGVKKYIAYVEFELCEDSVKPEFSTIKEQSLNLEDALLDGCIVYKDGKYQNLEQAVTFFEKRGYQIPCQMRIVNLDEETITDVEYKNPDSGWGDYEVINWDGKRLESQTYEYLRVDQEEETKVIVSNNLNMESSELPAEYYAWNEAVILSEKNGEESTEMQQVLDKVKVSDKRLQEGLAKRREMIVYNSSGDARGILHYDFQDDLSNLHISLRIEKSNYAMIESAGYSLEEVHPVYLFTIGEKDIGVAFLHDSGRYQGRRYDTETGEITDRISMCKTLEEVMDELGNDVEKK